jgi:membrane fusion protein (multidrug efflux system)
MTNTAHTRLTRNTLAVRRWTRTLILGALMAGGCDAKFGPGGPGRDGKDAEEKEEKASPVVTLRAGKSTVISRISSASTIEAERQVTIHAEATGRISKLGFEEGDTVEKGAMLGQIRRDAQASLLARASTSLEKSKADYERIKSLHGQGAASQEELDNARIAYQTAKLDRKDRRREVGDTRVLSPFSGTITERFVNDGAFVTNGAQLYSIVDFDTLVARVYVPEKELDRIRVGQEAQVVHKAGDKRRGVGSVQRIAPIVDATTGTVKVTVALPKDLTGQGGFLPGMYAEVTLTTEQHDDTLVLPKPALIHEEEQTFAFLVEGDRAKRVLLKTGLADDNQVEVLEGIAAGDEIILVGHAGLKDGALIMRVDESGAPVDGETKKPESDEGAVATAGAKGP